MLALDVEALVAFTVRTKVAELSHPAALVKYAVCVPATLKVVPFQEYGNAEGQILKLVVEVEVAFIVNTKLAALSHPTVFVV